LRWHVPVGVLKSSYEDHVDASSVQQTLVMRDSFTMRTLVLLGEIWNEMPGTSPESRLESLGTVDARSSRI